MKFEVEPTNASRGGTITIAGLRLKVFQEFNACNSVSFNVTPRINLPSDFYGEQILVKDFNQDSLLDLVAIRIGFGQRGVVILSRRERWRVRIANQFVEFAWRQPFC